MSAERFTLDTNILVYFHDFTDPAKQSLSTSIVKSAVALDCVLTLQSIGECFVSVRRVLASSSTDAARRARMFVANFPIVEPSQQALKAALSAAEAEKFAFWDALLLATAAEAGCTICLSEDMKDGAKLGSITVRNPFDRNTLSKAAQALLLP